MNFTDRFYFYNSSIGDLEPLVRKYVVDDLVGTSGFVTNAFGVKIRPKFFPSILTGREGVEPPPIPANWHADMAEFAAAFRAVDVANKKFTVVELGCGWGCWLNIAGVVAKRQGLSVNLVGVEGDAGHYRFALESLGDNGFSDSEFTIHHGVAASKKGVALFPRQELAGASWGSEPIFDAPDDQVKALTKKGTHDAIAQVPLDSLMPAGVARIDLLHVDIQGGEIPLIPDALRFLNEKVAMLLVGTHSRPIEGRLFEVLHGAGWRLEIERPAVISVGKNIQTLVDGVQLWRNPRLVGDDKTPTAQSSGWVKIVGCSNNLRSQSAFEVDVEVCNLSPGAWSSVGDTPVRISYHWLKNGAVVNFEGIRTEFSGSILAAGEKRRQKINVISPAGEGDFELKVTVVQDGVRWFDEPDSGFKSDVKKLFVNN